MEDDVVKDGTIMLGLCKIRQKMRRQKMNDHRSDVYGYRLGIKDVVILLA
jgi:hypothetical protein